MGLKNCPHCNELISDKIVDKCPICYKTLGGSQTTAGNNHRTTYYQSKQYELNEKHNQGVQKKEYVRYNPNAQHNQPVYDLIGVRGRYMKVYDDKCVIGTTPGLGSLITGNVSDGEKTIYYVDCVGVQFKRSNLQIGYLQLETASSSMNNKANNFFNENSFTYDESVISNTTMYQVSEYVKSKVEEAKNKKNAPTVAVSIADELLKFKQLLDMGALTQDEFDAMKKQLLGL